MQRFFVPPAAIREGLVEFDAAVSHQLRQVLRLAAGDVVVVGDGQGRAWQAELVELDRQRARARLLAEQVSHSEPATRITLYQGTLKADKFEWVLQKGTELGVRRFVPLIAQRSIVRDEAALAGKQPRWQSIVREAAEQSGRTWLPEVAPAQNLATALGERQQPADLRLICWENETSLHLRNVVPPVVEGGAALTIDLFIGPEGGFTDDEIVTARDHGFQVISLGPRILRAETAGLAAVVAMLYALQEM
jgi:16S rRNA (uracil1498-N3)-methyltransferase